MTPMSAAQRARTVSAGRYDELLQPLPGRTLVLAAHPDDEVCAIGLLQRTRDPVVLYATDGAPSDPWFWKRYRSREHYARVRRHEASAAMGIAGVPRVHFLRDLAPGCEFRDQELYRELPQALRAALEVVDRLRPEAVLVPAYEGGHPDHDACSFLGNELGRLRRVAVWEMPLYHRDESGALVQQRFRRVNGSEVEMRLNPSQLTLRAAIVKTYASQTDLESFAGAEVERYRPQAEYDYGSRPHEGTLNYEAWQWAIRPEHVSVAMLACRAGSGAAKDPQQAWPPDEAGRGLAAVPAG